MNTDLNTAVRTGLERLMHEFASASSDAAPIFHQRLSGLPDQALTKRTWDDFELANYLGLDHQKKGEWRKWVPHPDGTVCSRFVGVGDKAAFERFRRLADNGMGLLKTAAANAGKIWHFDTRLVEQIELDRTKETYLYWMEALHLTAKQCRTLFLDVRIGTWGHTIKPDETPEQVASAMSEAKASGLSSFPIHPMMESLQDDVFRSSAEAIKVWLGMDDVVHIGDWPDRPPIYLPPPIGDSSAISDVVRPSTPQPVVAEDEVLPSPAPVSNKLVMSRDTFTASYRGKTCELGFTKEFELLERLNQTPGIYIPVARLIDDVWKDDNTEKGTVQTTVKHLRRKIKKLNGIEIGSIKDHYKLILTEPPNVD